MDRAPVQTSQATVASPRAPRTHSDRCPTAIDLHEAADGLLARVRLPGGRLTPTAALGLARLAAPGATIELTGRANLQLRGLSAVAAAALPGDLAALGLLPSRTHERARTIVAGPLLGRRGAGAGGAALDALVAALDTALQAEPRAAALSGRAMTVVCDAAGHPLAAEADLLLVIGAAGDGRSGDPPVREPAERHAVVVSVCIGSALVARCSLEVAAGHAATLLGLVAEHCGAAHVWRVHELPGDRFARLVAQARDAADAVTGPDGPAADAAALAGQPAPALGVIAQPGGRAALRALAPLGRCTPAHLTAAAQLAARWETDLRLDVDRTLTLVDLPAAAVATVAGDLARIGLAVDQEAPAFGLSACAGLGCRSSLTDVRAAAQLRALTRRPGQPPEHFAGCARRCGAPPAGHTLVAVAGDTPSSLAHRAALASKEHTT